MPAVVVVIVIIVIIPVVIVILILPEQGEGGEGVHSEADAFIRGHQGAVLSGVELHGVVALLQVGVAVAVQARIVDQLELAVPIRSIGVGPVEGDLPVGGDIGVAVAGVHQVQVAQLRTVVLGDGVESIHRAVVQGIALVGDDAVHQQMHSIRISDLQPALIDVESGVCGDMGGDAVHLIGGGLIDHRGGGGVEIGHAPDGQRTGSHRRAVLLRVCAYRKLGLDPLLLQISGIDGHVILPEHAVHLDSKVVTDHEGIRVVLIGELEADGDLAIGGLSGQDAVDVAVIGHAGVAGIVVVPLQLPDPLFSAEVVSKGQIFGQVHHLLSIFIGDNIGGICVFDQPRIQITGQGDVEAWHGQSVVGGADLVSAAVDHALIAAAAGVDGDIGGLDHDLPGVGGTVAVPVIGPHGVDRGHRRDVDFGYQSGQLFARVIDLLMVVGGGPAQEEDRCTLGVSMGGGGVVIFFPQFITSLLGQVRDYECGLPGDAAAVGVIGQGVSGHRHRISRICNCVLDLICGHGSGIRHACRHVCLRRGIGIGDDDLVAHSNAGDGVAAVAKGMIDVPYPDHRAGAPQGVFDRHISQGRIAGIAHCDRVVDLLSHTDRCLLSCFLHRHGGCRRSKSVGVGGAGPRRQCRPGHGGLIIPRAAQDVRCIRLNFCGVRNIRQSRRGTDLDPFVRGLIIFRQMIDLFNFRASVCPGAPHDLIDHLGLVLIRGTVAAIFAADFVHGVIQLQRHDIFRLLNFGQRTGRIGERRVQTVPLIRFGGGRYLCPDRPGEALRLRRGHRISSIVVCLVVLHDIQNIAGDNGGGAFGKGIGVRHIIGPGNCGRRRGIPAALRSVRATIASVRLHSGGGCQVGAAVHVPLAVLHQRHIGDFGGAGAILPGPVYHLEGHFLLVLVRDTVAAAILAADFIQAVNRRDLHIAGERAGGRPLHRVFGIALTFICDRVRDLAAHIIGRLLGHLFADIRSLDLRLIRIIHHILDGHRVLVLTGHLERDRLFAPAFQLPAVVIHISDCGRIFRGGVSRTGGLIIRRHEALRGNGDRIFQMAVHHPGGCGIIPCRQGHRLRTCMARGLVGAAHGDFDAVQKFRRPGLHPLGGQGQIATADDNLSACVHLGAVLISCSGNGPAVEDIARSQRGLDRLVRRNGGLDFLIALQTGLSFRNIVISQCLALVAPIILDLIGVLIFL